jgi:hypothetical protein
MVNATAGYAVTRMLAHSALILEDVRYVVTHDDEIGDASMSTALDRVQKVIEEAVSIRADLREQLGITLASDPTPEIRDEGPTNA